MRRFSLLAILLLLLLSNDGFAQAISFDLSGPFPTLGPADAQAAGDLDFDGHTDVVTCSSPSNELEIFYGDGAGQLISTALVPAGFECSAINLHDLDNDGVAEIVVSSATTAEVTVFAVVGGTYAPVTTIPTASPPGRITFGDLDSDSDPDIVVNLTPGLIPAGVQVFENGGGLAFGSTGVISLASIPRDLCAADVTGDGALDLVLSTVPLSAGSQGALLVLEGNGFGTFAPAQTITVGFFGDLEIADLNSDGALDLVAVEAQSTFVCTNDLSVWLNDGGGTFTAGATLDTGCGPLTVRLGDFDNNGTVDALAADGGDLIPSMNILYAFKGIGNGGFEPPEIVAFGDFGILPIEVGDFDDSGTLDLALSGYFGGISMFLNDGQSVEFLRGDTNGDSEIDVSDAVFILASLFIPGSDPPACLDSGDVNDDGSFDVSDAVYELGALFVIGAPPIRAPSLACGFDPTGDTLTCVAGCP